jgi:hypothetical protein
MIHHKHKAGARGLAIKGKDKKYLLHLEIEEYLKAEVKI